MSRNYKVDSPLGSARTNIIFDGRDTLPKELMLETTLKVFDYNYDIFEVCFQKCIHIYIYILYFLFAVKEHKLFCKENIQNLPPLGRS